MEYYEVGALFADQSPNSLTIHDALRTISAIESRKDFETIEIRYHELDGKYSEIIVADCTNDRICSKNSVGIEFKERLALRFYDNGEQPEVRALRKDFPYTYHQNSVAEGEPISLCIYYEPWAVIARTWTPEKHLNIISNWLVRVAEGTLHSDDQPVEQLYFNTPYKLVLPSDYSEKQNDIAHKLIAWIPYPEEMQVKNGTVVILSKFIGADETQKPEGLKSEIVSFTLDPVIHGRVEPSPLVLVDIEKQLNSHGSGIIDKLFEHIVDLATPDGIDAANTDCHTIILLNIPILRHEGGEVESWQRKGFVLSLSLGEIGEKAGFLNKNGNKYYYTPIVGSEKPQSSDDWMSLGVDLIDIVDGFSRAKARAASGISVEGPNGVIAGVGALGSSVLNIWHRQYWGNWIPVDKDVVMPHNLARHVAYYNHIGISKALLSNGLYEGLYPLDIINTKSFNDDVVNIDNIELLSELRSADLIVDITTSLDVPRNLALRDDIKRCVSAFINHSGRDSIVLLEDSSREIRLDVLEAQYYGAMIESDWGNGHLFGAAGQLWVGAGCRDVSSIISTDLVQMHASIIARQIRQQSSTDAPKITIWSCSPSQNSVVQNTVDIYEPIYSELDSITIVWNKNIRDKVLSIRNECLPNETGGILVGYHDFTASRIYVVDALPAPPDSESSPTHFIRGKDGLKESVDLIKERTVNIVDYIGEWHSHPPKVKALPSGDDINLLADVSIRLSQDGLPGLMLIATDEEQNWYLGEAI